MAGFGGHGHLGTNLGVNAGLHTDAHLNAHAGLNAAAGMGGYPYVNAAPAMAAAGVANPYASTGAILVLFILLVIIARTIYV